MIVIFGQEINILSQIFGLIALLLIVVSYFCKRQRFLVVLSIAFVFCILEFAVINHWSICIGFFVSISRNITQLIYLKKQKRMPWWFSLIFAGAVIAVGIPFATHWYDFMPIVATVCFIFANHLKSYVALKGCCAFNEVLNITYAILAHTPVGALRETIALIAIIISIVTAKKHKTKHIDTASTAADN